MLGVVASLRRAEVALPLPLLPLSLLRLPLHPLLPLPTLHPLHLTHQMRVHKVQSEQVPCPTVEELVILTLRLRHRTDLQQRLDHLPPLLQTLDGVELLRRDVGGGDGVQVQIARAVVEDAGGQREDACLGADEGAAAFGCEDMLAVLIDEVAVLVPRLLQLLVDEGEGVGHVVVRVLQQRDSVLALHVLLLLRAHVGGARGGRVARLLRHGQIAHRQPLGRRVTTRRASTSVTRGGRRNEGSALRRQALQYRVGGVEVHHSHTPVPLPHGAVALRVDAVSCGQHVVVADAGDEAPDLFLDPLVLPLARPLLPLGALLVVEVVVLVGVPGGGDAALRGPLGVGGTGGEGGGGGGRGGAQSVAFAADVRVDVGGAELVLGRS